MDVEWECADGAPPPGPDEELPSVPGRLVPGWLSRVPRAGWWALTLIAVIAAVVPAVSRDAARHEARVSARPASATPASPGTQTPPVAPGASGAPPGAQAVIALVRQVALEPGPLTGFIRTSTAAAPCPLVRRGDSPRRRLSTTVHRRLPRFRVTDTAATLDPFAGMCVLHLRARAIDGTVLVLDVVAPQGADTGATTSLVGMVSDGVTQTSYATAVTATGWAVTVGSTGPEGGRPAVEQLRRLAEDPGMNW